MPTSRSAALCLSLTCLPWALVAGDDSWNQFRGPGSAGIASQSTNLPERLDRDANLKWSCEVPSGHSSPSVWGDRIYITGATSESLEVRCINRITGATLWTRSQPIETFESGHRINSTATPTAACDQERVYVYFGSYGVVCYSSAGELVWRKPLPTPDNRFGSGSSPILADGKLVFLFDTNAESFLEVLEPATGATLWRRERPGFGAGWSTPVVWTNGGVREIVVYGTNWVSAYALDDGSERWTVPGVTDEPCITPVTGEGLIFVTSYNMRTNPEVIGLPTYTALLAEYDADGDRSLTFEEIRENRSILSRNDADGEGDHPLPGFFNFLDEDKNKRITLSEWDKIYAFLDQFKFRNGLLALRPGDGERETQVVWQHARGVPEVPSPLYHAGRVLTVKNGGMVTCVQARDGRVLFEGRLGAGGPYYASPVVGDGKIFCASARGVVTVLRASDELEVLANCDLGERILATPALVGDTVYIRTEARLLAFSDAR